MEYFVIADMHFGDEAIRRYENRPFATTEEMDTAMIAGWNDTVRSEDTVYVLGDVGDPSAIARLNGRKLLVKGNHDTLSNEEYRGLGFAEVYDLPVILEDFWILSHEPMYVNTNMPYANLFGHVHANPAYRTVSPQSYCVSVERIGYRPMKLSEVKEAVKRAAKEGGPV